MGKFKRTLRFKGKYVKYNAAFSWGKMVLFLQPNAGETIITVFSSPIFLKKPRHFAPSRPSPLKLNRISRVENP